jgi:cysteine desulfurase family protein (TIGR01976 family)
MPQLNLDFVRRNFPALREDVVLLDNAGGSQVASQVAERITEFLFSAYVQLGATYATSAEASKKVHAGRSALATLMNAARPEEVVMGATSTQLFDQLARALVQTWSAGDEVIVTSFDHEANIGPWRKLADQGVVVKEWALRPGTHHPNLDDLRDLLTPNTRLVAMTHVSNIFGSIYPIREVADLVHENKTLLCVDGVAFAPHRAIDVQALGADFYAFSVYKVYGPHHAALYGRYDLLQAAGNINHYFYSDDKVPGKLEPGNANYELAYSCLGITDYLQAFAKAHGVEVEGRAAIEAAFEIMAVHEAELAEKFLNYLRNRDDVFIIGDSSSDVHRRVPTISFILEGCNSRDVVEAIDPSGIGIRYGDFNSKRLVESMNLPNADGVIRVSAVHYNTSAEFDRLIDCLEKLGNKKG